MLLKKKILLVKRTLKIELPADVARRLDQIEIDAKKAGLDAVIEAAIAQYLVRAVGHAEAELRRMQNIS